MESRKGCDQLSAKKHASMDDKLVSKLCDSGRLVMAVFENGCSSAADARWFHISDCDLNQREICVSELFEHDMESEVQSEARLHHERALFSVNLCDVGPWQHPWRFSPKRAWDAFCSLDVAINYKAEMFGMSISDRAVPTVDANNITVRPFTDERVFQLCNPGQDPSLLPIVPYKRPKGLLERKLVASS